MSEPVMRRTQSGQAENLFRSLQSPLAKTLSLCTVLSALAFTAVPAQAESAAPSAAVYSIESAKAKHSLLVDVAKAGTRLVAVGERGHILFSDDDGAQWQQAKVPSRVLLTSVYFSDDKHGWAVGHDATILASTDGGRSFAVAGRPDRLSLAGVTANAQGNLILVGQGGVRVASPTGLNLGQQ